MNIWNLPWILFWMIRCSQFIMILQYLTRFYYIEKSKWHAYFCQAYLKHTLIFQIFLLARETCIIFHFAINLRHFYNPCCEFMLITYTFLRLATLWKPCQPVVLGSSNLPKNSVITTWPIVFVGTNPFSMRTPLQLQVRMNLFLENGVNLWTGP